MIYVRIDFALFPGEIHWGDPKLHEAIPTDRDEVSSWLDKDSVWLVEDEEIIEEGSLESDSGIFVRESQEHGFLWFRKPSDVHSIGVHGRVPYATYEKSYGWEAYTLPFMNFLVDRSPGAKILNQEKIDWIFQNQFLMTGAYGSEQKAIEELKNSIRT